jgi:diguanylate cyclase (GGDEF)-like protein/PAS domain S-box-containing protein
MPGPTVRGVLAVAWPFLAIIAFLTLLAAFAVDAVSAARAFAGGESLWSKGEKEAVLALDRYIRSGAPSEYGHFRQMIAMPLGDHLARLELNEAAPDSAVIERSFEAGGLDSRDIPGMVRLYRYGGRWGPVAKAIDIWTRADGPLLELSRIGPQVHASILEGNQVRAQALVGRAYRIDAALTPMEMAFTSQIGEAARLAEEVFLAATLLSALAMSIAGMLRTAALVARSRRTEELIREQRERAQVTLEAIRDAVVTTTADGTVDYANPAAAALLGRPSSALRHANISAVCQFIEQGSRQELPHPILAALERGQGVPIGRNALLTRDDGLELCIDGSAEPIFGTDAGARGAVLVFRDVGVERATAMQLAYQASHDSLTGLINRREFERLVTEMLERRSGDSHDDILLFLDLDQFKVINDTCGHVAGDELLRRVGALLGESLRASDVLARLGGDEFGILLRGCALESALHVAEKLRQKVAELRFVCDRGSFSIGASIGVVSVEEGFREYSEVLSAADRACNLAKEFGRNRIQVYRTSDEELACRHGMMLWVGRIRSAIDEDRFRLYAQSIVPTRETRHAPARAEVLLRMVDRDGRIIPPMAFMPAAERYDLGPALDRWVIRNAFEQLARAGPRAFDICSINLGAASICDERLFDFIIAEQARRGLRADQICFEITETSAITQFTKACQLIEKLRAVGFHFALDDFGTGASSFAYLKALPVDYLKIDGAFVRDIPSNSVNRAMVEAIHHVAHVMGILTVAEFVESGAVLDRLRHIGVDFAQGYGIGKPEPLEAFLETERTAGAQPAAG